jgi:hypothetical protein
MFMDGRLLNVARIGFGIIVSENKWNELGKRKKFVKLKNVKNWK